MNPYQEIVKRYRPRGFRIQFSRRRNRIAEQAKYYAQHKAENHPVTTIAVADKDTKSLYVPYVEDEFTLNIYLHECGHVHLKHFEHPKTLHQEEFEAEQWAISMMRLEGIAVPHYVYVAARRYVRRCIKADLENEVAITPHVRKWAYR